MKQGVLLWAGENLLVPSLELWSQRSKGKHVAYAIRGGSQLISLSELVCLGGQEAAC